MTENEDDTSNEGFDDDALELMREDASKTVERLMQKHDAHQKKAIQMVQLNGVVISILVAGASQIQIQSGLNLFLYLGPALFLASAVSSGIALKGHKLSAGLNPDQIEQHLEAELTKTQYLLWYLVVFYDNAIDSLYEKTSIRAKWIRGSVYAFLGALCATTVGIIIRYAPPF